MRARRSHVETSYGRIAVRDTGVEAPPLVLLHGNSSCKEVFARQFDGVLRTRFRLLALDFPGHGESSDAPDWRRAYTLPGYADAVRQTMRALGVTRFLVCGWSLGGHVALELFGRGAAAGAVLSGAPAASHDLAAFAGAFAPHPCLPLFAKPALEPAEQAALLRAVYGERPPAFAAQALARTDGRARARLFESLREGLFLDGRATLAAAPGRVAAIDGAEDPFLAGVDESAHGHLWRGGPVRLAGGGHAPFRDAPGAFDRLVLQVFARTAGQGGARFVAEPAPERVAGF